ncbi:acyltransferase domain-containing protein [Streptomyces decoyicus]|uniref:acyltransferase domain-containing protein n=1 Tax=Streptomyces decoyicus TaxID=249567 RepID=UPI002E31E0CD|nr:acyltransferase domain-containing protein [Streptomyces decoyicus]
MSLANQTAVTRRLEITPKAPPLPGDTDTPVAADAAGTGPALGTAAPGAATGTDAAPDAPTGTDTAPGPALGTDAAPGAATGTSLGTVLDASAGRALPPTAVTAVLHAFGGRTRELPPRTVVFIGSTAALTGLPASHEGIPVRTAPSPAHALHLAHHELQAKTADLALVAGFQEPLGRAVTVQTLRRAAEAVAADDSVLGVLDFEGCAGPADEPILRPSRHSRRLTDPAAPRLLLWSGGNAAEEQRVRRELAPLLDGLFPEAFPALPTTMPCGQAPGPVRAGAVTTAERAPAAVAAARAGYAPRPRPVALLFPGQGSQHTAMAAGLYGREPVFTAAVDAVLELLGPEGPAIRADWLTDTPSLAIDDVRRAQPLLFAVDYGLGCMVLSWGIRPAAFLGHSAGELVAAVLAGVVPLSDAVTMMRERVVAAVRIPAGGMLAVAAGADTLRPYLRADVVIAAVNATSQTMLAGSTAPLAETAAALRADGHTVVTVPATSPFHSPAMAPAAAAVERAYTGIPFRIPTLPLYSGYTGDLLGPDDAVSPRFWARQITDPVLFQPALDQLLAADDMLLVEAGPRQTLTVFARRHRAVRLGASAAVPLLPARPTTPEADRHAVLTAACRLWQEGHQLKGEALARLWTCAAEEAGPAPATSAGTPPVGVAS